MSKDSIRVSGLNQAIRALKDVGVPASEIAAAGKDAAEIVAGEARTLVPVKTGKLKGSIRTATQQRKAIVRAGGARVPYANPIHWGWFRRGIKPNQFFSRAINPNIDKIYKQYFDNLQRLIDKYKGR
jgi:carbon monoxide dehydrogenase subunit G